MIIAILREHFRAQKFALLSLSVVIAVAAGFGAYAVTEASWKSAAARFDSAIMYPSKSQGAQAVMTDVGPRPSGALEDYGTPMTTAQFSALLDDAIAGGSDVWAKASWNAGLSMQGAGTSSYSIDVTALSGGAPWDIVWPSGNPVPAGSIALPRALAYDMGLKEGDEVTLWAPVDGPQPVATLTYAGPIYDNIAPDPWSWRGAYVNFADLRAISGLWEPAQELAADPNPITAQAAWSSDPQSVLAAGFTAGTWSDGYGPQRAWYTGGSMSAWLFAAVLGAGSVVMAAAAGRAQTQRRVQWISTARVLGARRAHFVGIGAAEAGIHAVAGAAGVAAGWAIADAGRRSAVAGVALPAPIDVAVPAVGWTLVATVIIALALVSAAIPAVLATRVEPVAALKETPAMDETELSRKVPFAPIAAAALVGWIATVALAHSESTDTLLAANLVGAVSGVLLVASLIEASRRTVAALGRRLQQSSRAVLIHAGLTVASHPRQAAAGAIIAGLCSAALSAWIVAPSPQSYSTVGLLWNPQPVPHYFDSVIVGALHTPALAVVVASQALLVMLMAGSRRLSAAEAAVSRTLGLDHARLVASQAIAWAVGPVLGWLGGAVIGGLVAASLTLAQVTLPGFAEGIDNPWLRVTQGTVTAYAVAVVLAALSSTLAFALAAVLERRPWRVASRSAA